MELAAIINNPEQFSPPITPRKPRHTNAVASSSNDAMAIDNQENVPAQTLPAASPPSILSSEEVHAPARSKKVFRFHTERKKAIPCAATATVNQPIMSTSTTQPMSISTDITTTQPMSITATATTIIRRIIPVLCRPSYRKYFDTVVPPKSLPPKKRYLHLHGFPTRDCHPNTDYGFAFVVTPDAIQTETQRLSEQSTTTHTATVKRKRTDSGFSSNSASSSISTSAATASSSKQCDRHIKKARTSAAMAYDALDITIKDELVYDKAWIPDTAALERKVKVVWKGSPMKNFESMPCYDMIDPRETYIPFILRLPPKEYLKCKRALILGAQEAAKENKPFRKSDAQKLCRIDVNKVSRLWDAFSKLGWLTPKDH